jgi:hypothetical protein
VGGSRHRRCDSALYRRGRVDGAARSGALRHGGKPAGTARLEARLCHALLPDIAFLPDAKGLSVDQLYRALDFLAVWSDRIEREVFLQAADLFRLDVDLIFYDTTTAYFEIDAADDEAAEWAGRLYAPLRRRGHNKEGRDSQPQVIVALAVTRDGIPVRSWVLPGDTADVATVARIKEDLRAWRLGRCVFVGDAGMYSAANLLALSRGLGRDILATPLRKLSEVEAEVLSRPGRYKPVADNLQVKEVVVGDGERRRRYVLCLNPQEAERQRRHREAVLGELAAELDRLAAREADHPKAACALLASRRYGRYLATASIRPRSRRPRSSTASLSSSPVTIRSRPRTWPSATKAPGSSNPVSVG